MSKTDEQLCSLAQAGDRSAEAELVARYEKLVYKLALRTYGRQCPMDDLLQEGRIILLHAVRQFNPARNTSFMTLAHRSIAHRLHRIVEIDRLLRRPQKWKEQGYVSPRVVSMNSQTPGDSDLSALIAEQPYSWSAEDIEAIRVAFAKLGGRERFVLSRRLSGRLLREIGSELGICRKMTHWIEKRAIEVLRALFEGQPAITPQLRRQWQEFDQALEAA